MRDGWRLGHLAREAVRNVLGRGARLLSAVGLAVVLGSGAVAFLGLETHALRTELDQLADQGRGVVNYTQASAEAPALISRASCERLAGAPGVQAAGTLIRGPEETVIPVGRAIGTQRASTTLFPQLAEADVLVGSGLVDRGDTVAAQVLRSGTVLDSLTTTRQREGLDASHTLTLPLRPDDVRAERCVVVLDPMVSVADVATTHLASLRIEGNAVVAVEYLRATSDPVEVFLDRPTRFLPVLLGVLGAVATAITYRLRASELAVYRLSGTSSRSLLVLIALETVLVTGIAGLAATTAAIVLRDHVLAPVSPILWGLVLAGTWGVLTLVATADLALRKPTDLAKDR